jgi:RimJ/RimL family protein N-acetyltransferase
MRIRQGVHKKADTRCVKALFQRLCGKPEEYQYCFTCKTGQTFQIRPAAHDDADAILRMYDEFEPKESAHGLPPLNPERRRSLVCRILEHSLSIIAETGGAVVGHGVLIDIEPGTCAELALVIHQDYQNRGMGSSMVPLLVSIARSCGYARIWLTVEPGNRKMIRVCQKCGFQFVGPADSELEMELLLG